MSDNFGFFGGPTARKFSRGQLGSRFHRFLVNTEPQGQRHYGILVHDHNETIAKKHTDLMRHFHQQGTLWTTVDRIIETPLFVDSALIDFDKFFEYAVAVVCDLQFFLVTDTQQVEEFPFQYDYEMRKWDRVGDQHYREIFEDDEAEY